MDLSASVDQYPIVSGLNQQWSLGLVLSLPLWSRYETVARVAAASADRMQAAQQADEALRIETAQREVLQQRIDLSQQNLVAAQGNLEKSGGLYKDMLKSFRFGRMSMNELLIEQNRLIESEMNLNQSQSDYHKILMESCAIAGFSVKNCFL